MGTSLGPVFVFGIDRYSVYTHIFFIGSVSKDRFTHDSHLFKVRFRQVIFLLLLKHTDRLLQVEDYARGCT